MSPSAAARATGGESRNAGRSARPISIWRAASWNRNRHGWSRSAGCPARARRRSRGAWRRHRPRAGAVDPAQRCHAQAPDGRGRRTRACPKAPIRRTINAKACCHDGRDRAHAFSPPDTPSSWMRSMARRTNAATSPTWPPKPGAPFDGFWLTAEPLLIQRIAGRRNDASDATVAVLQETDRADRGAAQGGTPSMLCRRAGRDRRDGLTRLKLKPESQA